MQGLYTKEKKLPERKCIKCHATNCISVELWESSCGGYEDEKFTCSNCKYTWWVEGPDA